MINQFVGLFTRGKVRTFWRPEDYHIVPLPGVRRVTDEEILFSLGRRLNILRGKYLSGLVSTKHDTITPDCGIESLLVRVMEERIRAEVIRDRCGISDDRATTGVMYEYCDTARKNIERVLARN